MRALEITVAVLAGLWVLAMVVEGVVRLLDYYYPNNTPMTGE